MIFSIKNQMKTKIRFIEEETEKLQNFIEQNDKLVLDESNLDNFLNTPDHFSKQ